MLLQKIPGEEKRFRYLHLYQAALKGNWQNAKDVLDIHPEAVKVPITAENETALHIAAAAKHTTFVKELLNRMDDNDLECTNKSNETALCLAAASGIVEIAQQMVEKNKELTLIRNSYGMTPLFIAASLGRTEMASYLFYETSFQALSSIERTQILFATISNDLYGMFHFSIIICFSRFNLQCHYIAWCPYRNFLFGHDAYMIFLTRLIINSILWRTIYSN